VQRVSDVVAILSQGELKAQAPMRELLSGKGNVAYTLKIKGNVSSIRSDIVRQPWVSSVEAQSSNGMTKMVVNVTDDARAKRNLLKLAMGDESITITNFSRNERDLEEVFMGIVEGSNNVG
jgi:ABC-type multidrug transport system ATPase subunit